MDKIFSARVDDSVIQQITNLAKQLKISKKQIIEGAIAMYAKKVEQESKTNIMDQTFGAWKRNETATETVKKARKAFQDSMKRHQQ
jgi:predicted transcriptional regulator